MIVQGGQPLSPVPPQGPVTPPALVVAVVGLALSFAGLIMAFFAIPFYGLRERFRRDHFSDRLLAESYLEDTEIVPSLIAIYEHVKQQVDEHPDETDAARLFDVESRGLIDTLLGHVVDYEEISELYDRSIFHGDLIWKFAVTAAALAVLFPALRYIWMIPQNHLAMTVYWMADAVIATGLAVTFVLYTRGRNRLMRLLETYARRSRE